MNGTGGPEEALLSRLAGQRIGGPFRCQTTVDSTNRLALELAKKGAAEGTVVLAERQTAGRGRLQRIWHSPAGCNLYLSIILRPAVAPQDLAQITLLAGVAAAETIAAVCPEGVGIKWPNDLLIRGRKVCGILTEMRTDAGKHALIVGIGLNVNISREDFSPELRESATSLREETGREVSRTDMTVALCERFGKWYETFLRDGFDPVREAWLARSIMVGKTVRVIFRDEVQEGTVTGIDRDGALLICAAPGAAIRRITAGDATIVKE
jgi:BirA family transcriptional regulator, biotin operon repressor / biotin---[acetyl-CoA-carboxylase] ligase